MCGIVGVLGQLEAAPRILDALKRLEYRGYDSAGLTTLQNGLPIRRRAVGKLGELPGVEVLTTPVINQGLVRFLDAKGDHDARTDQVIQRINETGEAWFGPTVWNGMRVMRISLRNFRTPEQDIRRTVQAVPTSSRIWRTIHRASA